MQVIMDKDVTALRNQLQKPGARQRKQIRVKNIPAAGGKEAKKTLGRL